MAAVALLLALAVQAAQPALALSLVHELEAAPSFEAECGPIPEAYISDGYLEDSEVSEETLLFEHCLRVSDVRVLSEKAGRPALVDSIIVRKEQVPEHLKHDTPVLQIAWPENVFFEFGESEVLPSSYPVLNLLADKMTTGLSSAKLYVVGHTDDVGTTEFNQTLSEARALDALEWLGLFGVEGGQMFSAGVGELQPIADNNSEQGRARNRRVAFFISESEKAIEYAIETMPVDDAHFSEEKPEDIRVPVCEIVHGCYEPPPDIGGSGSKEGPDVGNSGSKEGPDVGSSGSKEGPDIGGSGSKEGPDIGGSGSKDAPIIRIHEPSPPPIIRTVKLVHPPPTPR